MSTQPNDHLKDYLTGMHRADNQAMAQIMAVDDWTERAKEEVRRRVATRTLGCLDDQILKAIADGRVDLAQVAAEILNP